MTRPAHLAVLVAAIIITSCNTPPDVAPEGDESDEVMPFTAGIAIGTKAVVCQTHDAGLNLRSGAGTHYKVLDILSPGTEATVTGKTSSWYKIALKNGSEGWVYGKYLCPGSPSPTPDDWSCSGSYSTHKSSSGDYYSTVFGCWIDANGVSHGDSGDNCVPACLSQARAAGLCKSSWSGATCERRTAWYIADSGRFGCLQRLRLTHLANGKAVVVVALDAGPACWVEKNAGKGIIDMSAPTALYLFGSASVSWQEKKVVHVEEVSSSTPLGPF